MAQHMKMELGGELWLKSSQGETLSDRRIDLLEKIVECGSITAAARAVGMSYKGAWEALEAVGNLTGSPLLEKAAGGKGGGGTRLTEHGERLVATFRAVQQEHLRFLEAASAGIEDFEHFYELVRRLYMKTSARNQWAGKVTAIHKGAVNAEVDIALPGGERISAVVTDEGLDSLGIGVGSEVWAIVKASWVMLAVDDPGLKVSARNKLCGTVTRVVHGQVNTEVVVALPGGSTVSAVVTHDSAESLDLREGVRICALFKASSVILAVGS